MLSFLVKLVAGNNVSRIASQYAGTVIYYNRQVLETLFTLLHKFMITQVLPGCLVACFGRGVDISGISKEMKTCISI